MGTRKLPEYMRYLGAALGLSLAIAAWGLRAADCGLIEPAETAYHAGDLQSLRTLAARAGDNADAYQRAFIRYREALLAIEAGAGDDQVRSTIDLGLAILQADTPAWPRARALQAALYGLRIPYTTMGGMRLGPKASGTLEPALEAAPDDPVVLLIEGISEYRTPGLFGGDKERATELFRRVLAAHADADEADAVCWGETDARLYLARLHHDAEHFGPAREQLEAILKRHPAFAPAREMLASLPPPAGTIAD